MSYAISSPRIDAYPLCFHFLKLIDSFSEDDRVLSIDSNLFLDWMDRFDVAPAYMVSEIRRRAYPDEMDALSREAVELGTWFREFLEDFSGKPLPSIHADRLMFLNRFLERDAKVIQLEVRDGIEHRIAGSGLRSAKRRIWRSSNMLLLPIADDIARLLCEQDFSDVFLCEATDCGTYFINKMRQVSPHSKGPCLCKFHDTTSRSNARSLEWR